MSGNTPSDFESFIRNSTEPLFSIVVDITDGNEQPTELPTGINEIFADGDVAGILQRNGTTATVANKISPNKTRLVLHANNEVDADKLKKVIEKKSHKYLVKTELNLVRVPEFNPSEIYPVAQVPGRNLGAAPPVGSVAFYALRATPSVDTRDGQLGGSDWAMYVLAALGDAKPVATLGVMDTGIAAAHSFFSDVKMTRYDCANGIECSYTNYGNPTGDDVGHGTHVAGIAASRYPWDAIVDLDVLPSTGGLNSIYLALLEVEKELAAKEKLGKPYTYLVNASLFFMAPVAKKVAGKVSESAAKDYNSLAIQISEKIQALHKKYPRFQFVACAGNSDALEAGFYPAGIPGVRSIAAHNAYDAIRYLATNFGAKTKVSAPGVNVASASSVGGPDKLRDSTGTSMASPAATADQAVIMALMPKITAAEAVEILEAIAIPVDQFPVLQDSRPIAAPASSLDLRSFLQYLDNNDLNGAVIPAALTLMRRIDAAWLDNIAVVEANDVINSIPNYSGKINFNANDQVEFTFTANAGKGGGNGIFRFTLGTAYVPPIGVNNFIDQPVMPGTYFTPPTQIIIPKDGTDQTFKVAATRIVNGAAWSKQQSVQIVVSKQVRPGIWEPVQSFTTAAMPVANDKLNIDNLILGVSRTAGVTVKALSPLSKFGAPQATLAPAAATTQSPTPKSTSQPSVKATKTPKPTKPTKPPTLAPSKPTAATEAPTPDPTNTRTLEPTKPSKNTKPPTQAPTAKEPTPYPTRFPTGAPTGFPTKPPTLAPTRSKLEVGDCQLINIEPPTKDFTFTLKVEEKKVVFKKGEVEVQDKNGKVILARNLAGLTTNPNVISSLDKGTRYMFQISNNDGKFSISYVPLKKVKIRGTKKFAYKAASPIQQAVSWTNTKALDVSMLGIAPANIKADNAHGCEPVTRGRMLSATSGQLPNNHEDNFGLAQSNKITPAQVFFSAAATAATQVSSMASQYLPSGTSDTNATDNSTEEPSLMQMVTNGLPLAVAAMTFLGLFGYAAYTQYSKNPIKAEQEQDPEAMREWPVETVVMRAETATTVLAELQKGAEKEFSVKPKPLKN